MAQVNKHGKMVRVKDIDENFVSLSNFCLICTHCSQWAAIAPQSDPVPRLSEETALQFHPYFSEVARPPDRRLA